MKIQEKSVKKKAKLKKKKTDSIDKHAIFFITTCLIELYVFEKNTLGIP